MPSDVPSNLPVQTQAPFLVPSDLPSDVPSKSPVQVPSDVPSGVPSKLPVQTQAPFLVPSDLPSDVPSKSPVQVPSDVPSGVPSAMPVSVPGRLSRFKVTDASSQEQIRELDGSEVIDLQVAGVSGFNILASKSLDAGSVNSVVFSLGNSVYSVANTEPYYMCNGACPFEGLISISAVTYSGPNGSGLPGETRNVTFTVVPKPPLPTTVLINCGAAKPYTDTQLRKWAADMYFVTGKTFNSGTTQPVANTVDDTIYFTDRNNNFKYEIPVPPGEYEIKMHFAEVSEHVLFLSKMWQVFNVAHTVPMHFITRCFSRLQINESLTFWLRVMCFQTWIYLLSVVEKLRLSLLQ